MIKRITKYFASGLLPFILAKNLSLVIQFSAILIVASKLGAFYFGVWSFIMLVREYLQYSNLGIQYSMNATLAVKSKNKGLAKLIFQNAFTSSLIIGVILFVIWVMYFTLPINFGEKYSFRPYSGFLIVFVVLENMNQLFINLYRVYSKIFKVALFHIFASFAKIIPVIFLDGKSLIYGLLIFQIIFSLITLIFFVINPPINIGLSIDLKILRVLFKRGINLLFYNLSFYFLLISTRTFVSYFYSVDIFGEFGFAMQLAMIAQVGLSTITFLFFPKILNRLGKENEFSIIITRIDIIKEKYIFAYMFISMILIGMSPLIAIIFPQYKIVTKIFLIALTINIALSFKNAHSSFMISWAKEFINTKVGAVAIFINIVLLYTFHYLFQNIYFTLSATILSSILYSYLIIYNAEKVLNKNRKVYTLKETIEVTVPILIAFVIYYLKLEKYLSTVPLLVFSSLNIKKLYANFKMGVELLTNPKSLHL